ncbi:MAG: PLP-dependent aminotransferase family protein, partial [Vicinamibacterales bacterium]
VWNKPAGGFFLTVSLPFEFGRDELRSCAADHGVIVTPMSFFALRAERTRQVRLSFSSVEPADIREGLRRSAGFVRSHAGR